MVHHHLARYNVEQYRRLAASLHHIQRERGIKTIMVASAQSGEGKTLTAANLSLTLSESYRRRVLLIDADLRRPSLDALLRVPSGTGLSDCLRDSRPLRLVDVSEHLVLLPGGRPESDPMAVLSSARMKEILEQTVLKFDWVILDTPPVALLPDAHVLASMVEATVLVIEAASTPFAMIKRAIETLGPDKIVGVVLNRVENRVVKAEGHYGYYAATKSPTENRRWWRLGARPADEGQTRGVLGLSHGPGPSVTPGRSGRTS